MNGGLSVDDKGVFYLYKNYPTVHIKLLIKQITVLNHLYSRKLPHVHTSFAGFGVGSERAQYVTLLVFIFFLSCTAYFGQYLPQLF
jgi:hypothetical protein